MLAGVTFDGVPEGARLNRPEVLRGLAWVRALSVSELQLSGRVSEIDVSEPLLTGLLLMSRTRVIASAWPPDLRTLSALRVVLADLDRQGTLAHEVDLRFRDQVIVRPTGAIGAAVNPTVAGGDRTMAAGSEKRLPMAASIPTKRKNS